MTFEARQIGADDSGQRLVALRVPSQPERLRLIRAVIAEAAQSSGCSQDCVRDIVLAVDEACQNVIRHAYGGDPNREIYLDIRLDEDHIVFDIVDFAEPVDVEKIRPRSLDDVRPGGLGTHFIKECMDKTEYPPRARRSGEFIAVGEEDLLRDL